MTNQPAISVPYILPNPAILQQIRGVPLTWFVSSNHPTVIVIGSPFQAAGGMRKWRHTKQIRNFRKLRLL